MWIKKLTSLLNRPSSLNLSLGYNSGFALSLATLVSIVVWIVIWPDTDYNWSYKLSDALFCGLVAGVIFALNLSSIPHLLIAFFNPDKWTIGKDVLFTSWVFFLIGTANMLSMRFLGRIDFEWQGLMQQQFFSLLIGVPAVTCIVVYRNQQLNRKYLKISILANQQLEAVPNTALGLKAPNKKLPLNPAKQVLEDKRRELANEKKRRKKVSLIDDHKNKFEAFIDQLILIHSEKGKLQLFWLNEENQLQISSLSMRLKDATAALDFEGLLRCHRFFWVQIHQIEEVAANARGLQLKMHQIPKTIPVSKTYLSSIRSHLGL